MSEMSYHISPVVLPLGGIRSEQKYRIRDLMVASDPDVNVYEAGQAMARIFRMSWHKEEISLAAPGEEEPLFVIRPGESIDYRGGDAIATFYALERVMTKKMAYHFLNLVTYVGDSTSTN